MGIYTAGAPLKITGSSIFKGLDRTNGFVMRNVDGRIPALQDSFSKVVIGAGNVLFTDAFVPYGNALWTDLNTVDVSPGAVLTDKPTKGILSGVLAFNQGFQTGHPIMNWGVPQYGKGTRVRKGYVGYKQTMTAVGQEANYLALLKGDSTKDVGTVRKVYADWMATLKAAADGSRLGIFFGNASGFPIMAAVIPANIGSPVLANATFGGFVEVLEKENGAVFVALRDQLTATPAT